jgi:hypothetical protein
MAVRTPQRLVTANAAVSLLAVTGGLATAPYDARPAMLFGASLLGWSQLVGL